MEVKQMTNNNLQEACKKASKAISEISIQLKKLKYSKGYLNNSNYIK